jgi:hypothetical protein
MSQSDRILDRIAIAAALLVALALVLFILAMPRGEKPEYPPYEPTELPVLPSWTPDPDARGKG